MQGVKDTPEFVVFPNPANNILNVKFTHNGNSDAYVELIDITGKLVRSFRNDNLPVGNSLKYGCALPGGRIAYVVTHQPGTIKIATEIPFEQIQEISPAMESDIKDLKYIPNTNSILWCNEQGIFITDVNTGITQQIKKDECGSVVYTHLSVSPSGDKFLVSTLVYSRIEKCMFRQKNEIRKMNIDGSEETVIPLSP